MKTKNGKIYDIVDYADRVICRGTKKYAKKLNLFTRRVHILLLNKKGQVLICRRSPDTKRYANQITSSAGGHVELGESYKFAAMREMKEELFIKTPLKDIGRFDLKTASGKNIHHLFVGKLKGEIKPDPGEIAECYLLSPNFIKNDIALHPRRYAKPFHKAFALFLEKR